MMEKSEAMEFSKRLNKMLDEEGFPPLNEGRQTELGKIAKVSQNSARKWLIGETIPRQPRLVLICNKFGREPHWLRFGTLSSGTADLVAVDNHTYGSMYTDVVVSIHSNSDIQMKKERISVPISTEYLAGRGLVAERCTVIFAPGENMQPAIRKGDLLLVNRDNRSLEDGRIYVFRSKNTYRVNLVSVNADDSVTLVSENKDYPSERVPARDIPDLTVTGVVEKIEGDR